MYTTAEGAAPRDPHRRRYKVTRIHTTTTKTKPPRTPPIIAPVTEWEELEVGSEVVPVVMFLEAVLIGSVEVVCEVTFWQAAEQAEIEAGSARADGDAREDVFQVGEQASEADNCGGFSALVVVIMDGMLVAVDGAVVPLSLDCSDEVTISYDVRRDDNHLL